MSAISYTTEDRVATIRINRPERRNALNHGALDEMHDAIRRASEDGLRALVLTGSDGHFCAGADLTELEDLAFTDSLRAMLDDLAGLEFPTIAAVAGSCMGLGMQLAVACDVRVVADSARFAVPVAKLGLMVDHWTIDRVRRLFGEGAARHLVLTGAVLDADDAWRLGFAQVRGGLDDAVALATSAAGLAPLSQAGSKIGLDVSSADTEGQGRYAAAFAAAWASADLAEGRAAFTQRRSPEFMGR